MGIFVVIAAYICAIMIAIAAVKAFRDSWW